MNYRNLDQTKVFEVGLGTWQLGSSDWGDIDRDKAFQILDTFVKEGGNFIDTADVYGNGHSEQVIGDYLKTTDKKVFVATKLGRRQDGDSGWPQNFTKDKMREHIERSLKNLKVDQLFLEQLHCIPTEVLKIGKVFDYLREFQEEGLIQHWGVSVETEEEALLCLREDGITNLQIIFNLLRQHYADSILSNAQAKGVSILARVPLASGILSGKFTKDTKFNQNDHRHYNADGNSFNVGETFAGIKFETGVELAEEIKAILPQDHPMPQLSLRWILDHPAITSVIPGASKPEHVLSNIKASGIDHLSEEIHQKLKSLYDHRIKPEIRGNY